MHGVVPVAGAGTRLHPLTDEQPKGLVEIDGRPLLSYVFATLVEAGIDELVVVVGYEGDQIVDTFGEAFHGVPITYVRQAERRGLGHAVLQAKTCVDGPFVVLNGDNVFGGGIGNAIERFADPPVDGVLLVEAVSVAEAREVGVVEMDGDLVTDVVEKPDEPASTLVTTGCYVLPEAVFDAIESLEPSERGEYELSEAVGVLVDRGRTIVAEPLDGWRVNVNRPGDIERVEDRLG